MSGKKKQIYVTIMLLGAVALLCDRFLFGGAAAPEVATAQEAPEAVGSADPPGSSKTTFASVPELPFPRAIGPRPVGAPLRDLFADPGVAGSSAAASAPDKSAARGVEFAARHVLQGVLIQPSARYAVIDNAMVQVNDVVDGCTVSEIREREVRVVCGERTITLTLPMPAGRPGHAP